MLNLKIIEDWKIWKWIYRIGMTFGSYLFIGTVYNMIISLIPLNSYLHLLEIANTRSLYLDRPFYPFFSAECIIDCGVRVMLILVLPCLISIFFERKYFYKIIYILIAIPLVFAMIIIHQRFIL